jgi:hypothetical protein
MTRLSHRLAEPMAPDPIAKRLHDAGEDIANAWTPDPRRRRVRWLCRTSLDDFNTLLTR